MKKCKCIKESSWFLIDDSFDEDSKTKGGKFSFEVNETYEYNETESFFGKGYSVIHPIHGKENPTGFDENRFLEHFQIINS